MINNDSVLMYGGIARGLWRRGEIGGDNWHAIWYNKVLRVVYRGSLLRALVVGE